MPNTEFTHRTPAAVHVVRLDERGHPSGWIEARDVATGKVYVEALAIAEPDQRYEVRAHFVLYQ